MLATFILKLILLFNASPSDALSPHVPFTTFTHTGQPHCSTKSHLQMTAKFEDLMEMDIVLFAREDGDKPELGAMQEDGTVAPLSAWTLEPAYGSSLEFVVDEENRFPGLTGNDIKILSILDETLVGFRKLHIVFEVCILRRIIVFLLKLLFSLNPDRVRFTPSRRRKGARKSTWRGM